MYIYHPKFKDIPGILESTSIQYFGLLNTFAVLNNSWLDIDMIYL